MKLKTFTSKQLILLLKQYKIEVSDEHLYQILNSYGKNEIKGEEFANHLHSILTNPAAHMNDLEQFKTTLTKKLLSLGKSMISSFTELYPNNGEKLDQSMFLKWMMRMAIKVQPTQIKDIWTILDSNNSGLISLQAFSNWIQSTMS